jgi:hypothetical protein
VALDVADQNLSYAPIPPYATTDQPWHRAGQSQANGFVEIEIEIEIDFAIPYLSDFDFDGDFDFG